MKHLNLKLMLLLLLQFGIVNAQSQKVKGIVKDTSGEPLIGVNVLLKLSNLFYYARVLIVLF